MYFFFRIKCKNGAVLLWSACATTSSLSSDATIRTDSNAARLLSLSPTKLSVEEKSMEGIEGESSGAGRFTLPPMRISNEDIIFCVDVDAESLVEMKSTGFNGKPITRLDAMKQAILLFVNSKLSINPDHRFALVTLAKTASWVFSLFPLFIFQLNL